jgi:ABC-type lipoprotein release transport system permease subunit
MKPIMNINDFNTIEQMERFLTGGQTKLTVYSWQTDKLHVVKLLAVKRTVMNDT